MLAGPPRLAPRHSRDRSPPRSARREGSHGVRRFPAATFAGGRATSTACLTATQGVRCPRGAAFAGGMRAAPARVLAADGCRLRPLDRLRTPRGGARRDDDPRRPALSRRGIRRRDRRALRSRGGRPATVATSRRLIVAGRRERTPDGYPRRAVPSIAAGRHAGRATGRRPANAALFALRSPAASATRTPACARSADATMGPAASLPSPLAPPARLSPGATCGARWTATYCV